MSHRTDTRCAGDIGVGGAKAAGLIGMPHREPRVLVSAPGRASQSDAMWVLCVALRAAMLSVGALRRRRCHTSSTSCHIAIQFSVGHALGTKTDGQSAENQEGCKRDCDNAF